MEEKTTEHDTEQKKVPDKRKKSGKIWRSYGYYIFFIAAFIMYELILRAATVKQFGSAGFLFSIVFNVILAVFICYTLTFFSKKTRVIVNNIFLIIATVFYVSQILYYNVFGTFYSADSIGFAGQIFQFWETILATAWAQLFYIVMCLVPIPAYNLIVRRTTIASVRKKLSRLPRMEAYRLRRRRRISMCAALIAYVAMIIMFIPFAVDSTTSYSIFFGQTSYEDSVERMGLLSTLQVDLLKVFIKEDASGALTVLEDPWDSQYDADYGQYGAGAGVDGINGSGSPEGEESGSGQDGAAPQAPAEYGYNVMDIDFAALIAGETNEVIMSLDEYFAYVRPTRQNEYTGMFAGYNLIEFVAEAFYPIAVDPELTPTLYKLVHEGFYFPNFYTPIWTGSTSSGEYVACTGLLPKSGAGSMSQSSNNYLPFTMGNQLRNLGYLTLAYHNHTYTYYGRDRSHPNMGYTYKGIGNGLVLPSNRWPNSDLEMMEATVDEYIRNEPFHAYYMTVSGHLEYNFSGNAMAIRNRAAVADLPYSDPIRAYIACNIELDKALEYLLQRLNEAGIAERTVIVLSADHYPYGLTNEQISEYLGHPVDETFELHKNHLIIYAQGMEPVTVDKVASSLDILPTISNLMGLTFDSRLLMGRDLLSEGEGLLITKERDFLSDSGYYRKRANEFVPNPGVEVDENYVRFMNNRIDNAFIVSARILDYNYYAKVFR